MIDSKKDLVSPTPDSIHKCMIHLLYKVNMYIKVPFYQLQIIKNLKILRIHN